MPAILFMPHILMNSLDRLGRCCVYMYVMKTTYPMEELIDYMEDMMKDVDQLLESPTVEKKSAIRWREDTKKKISTVFGENHPYVREFEAIDFATPFINGADKVMLEDTYRLGLEDGKSYLIAMMDELESEYYNVLGMMDIETTFYELGKYIIAKIKDAAIREDLLQRISILSCSEISFPSMSPETSPSLKIDILCRRSSLMAASFIFAIMYLPSS